MNALPVDVAGPRAMAPMPPLRDEDARRRA